MSEAQRARRIAEWAERKAQEASESSEPWATLNLRTYQNMASRYWTEHYRAERDRR